MMNNLFEDIPEQLPNEIFNDLLKTDKLRIERIVSGGQSSPDEGWYEQTENEWVLVMTGYGVIEFEGGRTVRLNPGDYLNIQAMEKHKVKETSKQEKTVWLAIFY